MRLLVRILKWSSVALLGLIIILISLSLLLHDRVIDIFLASINREISTRITVEKSSLSLLKRFPKASVELNNLTVLSSSGIEKSQFSDLNTDTLLLTPSVILEFSIIDIINGKYNIESVIIDGGKLLLLSDTAGNTNYEISSSSTASGENDFNIDLKKIVISGLNTRYKNTATKLDIRGKIEDGKLKSRIWGEGLEFNSSASIYLERVDLYSASVRPGAAISLDVNLQQSDSGTLFRKGLLKLGELKFGLSGFVGSDDMMDLNITGQGIDLEKIKKYLPDNLSKKIQEYSPSGILETKCVVKGYLTRFQNPLIKLNFSLGKGRIIYSKSNISLNDLRFSGSFTNGYKRDPSSSVLILEDLGFILGSSEWNGKFTLENLTDPEINLTVSGDLIPSELKSFLSIPEIKEASGSFHFNFNLSGRLPDKKKYSVSDIIGLNPEAVIEFSSFGITHEDEDYSVSDVDGNIMIAKNLWAENLVLTYKGQRIKLNMEFTNFTDWITGRPVKIKITADLSAANINPVLFMGDTSSAGGNTTKAYIMPSGIDADINFNFDNLTYGSFKAGNLRGKLRYRPGVADFKNLAVSALDGSAAGSLFIAQNRAKSFLAQGDINFSEVDVKKAFNAFNNFGQTFIKAENLEGIISGNLTILVPMDSLLKADVKSVTADGKYIIENGRLINFEPVKELSDFIELSELEDISFSRLENDLFIRNNYLAVPQMDIKSSAADFSVNGRHSFDLNYEYHVKAYLSEILSKKARKNSKTTSEFGAVEDDGLGRTSVYLKITGNDVDTKVVYDLKAAGNNVKQNLKNERGKIKSILNEEYGWFKGDTAVRQEAAPKPKFKIEFSETDTTSAVKETAPKKAENGFNRIFRKKKGFSDL